MKVIVDRIENGFLVVEIGENNFANMPCSLAPLAKEGDVISIEIDDCETKKREERIAKKMNDLFKKRN